MFSEHHKDWALSIQKMIHNHKKCMYDYLREKDKCYKIVERQLPCGMEDLYKRRMKSFQSARKIFLFINRTKLQYFSFQPRILKFWRTISRKRKELLKDIDEKLISEASNDKHDKQCKYLLLFKRTLEKYDTDYGLQVGLLLHVKFSKDIALVINEYLM